MFGSVCFCPLLIKASSRSHCILELHLGGAADFETETAGLLRVVDLAGSERNFETQMHSRSMAERGGSTRDWFGKYRVGWMLVKFWLNDVEWFWIVWCCLLSFEFETGQVVWSTTPCWCWRNALASCTSRRARMRRCTCPFDVLGWPTCWGAPLQIHRIWPR